MDTQKGSPAFSRGSVKCHTDSRGVCPTPSCLSTLSPASGRGGSAGTVRTPRGCISPGEPGWVRSGDGNTVIPSGRSQRRESPAASQAGIRRGGCTQAGHPGRWEGQPCPRPRGSPGVSPRPRWEGRRGGVTGCRAWGLQGPAPGGNPEGCLREALCWKRSTVEAPRGRRQQAGCGCWAPCAPGAGSEQLRGSPSRVGRPVPFGSRALRRLPGGTAGTEQSPLLRNASSAPRPCNPNMAPTRPREGHE